MPEFIGRKAFELGFEIDAVVFGNVAVYWCACVLDWFGDTDVVNLGFLTNNGCVSTEFWSRKINVFQNIACLVFFLSSFVMFEIMLF